MNHSRCGSATGLVLVVVVVGLLIAAGFWAMQSQMGKADAAGARRDLVSASVRSFDINTVASGTIETRNRVEIRSRVEARSTISYIIDEGTLVRPGTVLLRLNTETIEQEIASQELEVANALAAKVNADNDLKNQTDQNESNLRKANLKVELAELGLAQWEEEDKKEVIRLDQAYASAERNLNRLLEKVDESRVLTSKGYYSVDRLQLDEIELEEAKARIKTAGLDREIYAEFRRVTSKAQADSDLTEAKADRERQERSDQNTLESRQATLDNRIDQLRIREERLAKLRSQLEMCVVVAPIEGLVVYATSLGENNGRGGGGNESPLQVGTEIRYNELVMILPDAGEMRARVKVNEALSGKVQRGQHATITVNALGKKVYTGVVDSIGVLAEGGGWRDPNRREYTVFVTITGGDVGALKPSMRCDADIQLGQVASALSVPVPAVFTDGPVRYVYAMQNEQIVRVPVKVGLRSNTYAEILAGLEDGSRVLVRRPDTGEVEESSWDRAQLEVAGLSVDEQGNPIDGSMQLMPAMMRDGGATMGSGGTSEQGGAPPMDGNGARGPGAGNRPGTGNRSGRNGAPTSQKPADGDAPAKTTSDAAPVGTTETKPVAADRPK